MNRSYDTVRTGEPTLAHTIVESLVVVLMMVAFILVIREIVGTSSHRVIRADHATFIGFAVR